MKILNVFIFILAFGLFVTSCTDDKTGPSITEDLSQSPLSDEGAIISDQYIISLSPDFIPPAISQVNQEDFRDREQKAEVMEALKTEIETKIYAFLAEAGVTKDEILHVYSVLDAGAALKIPVEKYDKIRQLEQVVSVEYDREVQLPDFTIEEVVTEENTRAQTTPCGITNAGGYVNANQSRWIWVVDTGIDLDHPDLNVQTSSTYAKSFVGGSANDCNGHGTHCAGTAAARNNSIGVVGVAANAVVVPVRVLNCSGSGSTSGIISGLNHVATYDLPGDVVNMSLGGYYGGGCANGSSYRTVVKGLGNAGTRVAIAAGNSSANSAYYQPACINNFNVFTISSMTCGKSFSGFSNYNMNPVDYIATGSSVYSTYKNGGYATLSGTSMAAPHVAGICQVRNNGPRGIGTVYNRGENYPIAKR